MDIQNTKTLLFANKYEKIPENYLFIPK